jgi:hypothetical protein
MTCSLILGFFKDFVDHASFCRQWWEEFSKPKLPKLINTYLRTFTSQESLSSLDTLSIENTIAQNLDFSELAINFAAMNSRKVNFYWSIL